MAVTSSMLDCTDAGVMDLIFNEESLQVWEYIRSLGRYERPIASDD